VKRVKRMLIIYDTVVVHIRNVRLKRHGAQEPAAPIQVRTFVDFVGLFPYRDERKYENADREINYTFVKIVTTIVGLLCKLRWLRNSFYFFFFGF